MKKIKITQGLFVKVDDSDYATLNKHPWFVQYTGAKKKYPYAVRKVRGKKIPMHRHIMGNPVNMHVDHINHDTLDNRRCNLRVCTATQNKQNQETQLASRTGKKGVQPGYGGKFVVFVRASYVGTFDDIKAAAMAYDIEAIRLFGEFASTNYPECDLDPAYIAAHKTGHKGSHRAKTSSKTGYLGVTPRGNRFTAYVCIAGKVKELGTCDTAEDAAKLRDKMAKRLIGPNVTLNFP